MELVVSIFAVLISLFAVWETRKANRNSLRLTEQEIELIRHQLAKARNKTVEEKKANVTAQMYRDGKGWRVRVLNLGPAEARHVRLILDDQNMMVIADATSGKFPMDRMTPGQYVDFWARVHLATPPKETLVIHWDDPYGVDRENKVELTT